MTIKELITECRKNNKNCKKCKLYNENWYEQKVSWCKASKYLQKGSDLRVAQQ